jgi:hypothetical protein
MGVLIDAGQQSVEPLVDEGGAPAVHAVHRPVE